MPQEKLYFSSTSAPTLVYSSNILSATSLFGLPIYPFLFAVCPLTQCTLSGSTLPVLCWAHRAVCLAGLLRGHDDDGVIPAVGLVQAQQMHLLRLLHVHLCRDNTGLKSRGQTASPRDKAVRRNKLGMDTLSAEKVRGKLIHFNTCPMLQQVKPMHMYKCYFDRLL